MTGPAVGPSSAGVDDPQSLALGAINSFFELQPHCRMADADAALLAALVCARFEHGGYPLTCLMAGDVVLAMPDRDLAEDAVGRLLVIADEIAEAVDEIRGRVWT